MARILNVQLQGQPWSGLVPDQRLVHPVLERPGFRAEMQVARSGFFPGERKETEEVYLVLKGSAAFEGAQEMLLREGQAVVFAPRERHGLRVDDGVVLLHLTFED